MPESVVAIASRVQEIDARLAGLAGWSWRDGVPAHVGGEPVPGLRVGGGVIGPNPAWSSPPVASVASAWSAPFEAVLGKLVADTSVGSTSTMATGILVDPVPGGRVSQPYGLDQTGKHGHDGLDIAAPLGTPVRAMAAGVVRFAGPLPDGAVVVRIEHPDGSEAWYGHLDPQVPVRVGDRVAAGDRVGRIGLTGRTTGPHLHLEVWSAGRPIDPLRVLRSGRLPGWTAPAAVEAALRRFDAVAPTIPHAGEIRAAAVRAGIDPLLLAALVHTESGFRPAAVSRAGAIGLTQLMPATARSLGVADPFDPAANLDGGARYLAGNLRIFGRVDLALAAYQAGKAAVRRAGGVPDSPVTQGYVARVLETWADYLAAAGSET